MNIVHDLREELKMPSKYNLVNDKKIISFVLCPVKELPMLRGLECAIELNITFQ